MHKISICDWHNVPNHACLPITQIISIGGVEDLPDIRCYRERDLTLHRFVFTDISHIEPEKMSPSKEIVQRLIDISKNFKDSDHVLFHCAAGISRSPAAAFISLIVKGATFQEAYREVTRVRGFTQPNLLMIYFADQILDKKGAMLKFAALASGRPDYHMIGK